MNETTSPQEEKGGNKKKYMLIGVGLIVALGLIYYITDKIFIYLGQREVQKMAETMQEYEEQALAAQTADTYGGTTPQETLRLFIEAMEKEDYELASKYFIIERQAQELEEAKNASKEDIENILSILKTLKLDDKRKAFEEDYERQVAEYGLTEPKEEYIERISKIYEEGETMSVEMEDSRFIVSFFLYPNGVWKIEEM